MTDKEKVRKEIQRLQDLTMDENKNFYSEAAEGEYNALCNIEHFIDSLQEEHVSEDLEDAAYDFVMDNFGNPKEPSYKFEQRCFRAGAKWQKEHLWKPADGDDLPEIDREIIVLCKNCRVAFGHRPVEKFMARPIGYGKFEEYEVKTYDKGGWNIPDVKWWLDCGWPKQKEE